MTMSKEITVFTMISPSYESSSEFILCLKMFREALPSDAHLVMTGETHQSSLRTLIADHIPGIVTPYVLIVKEPALIMEKGTIEAMLDIMTLNQHTQCVLPSDIRGFRSGRVAAYSTLRGFERFVASLFDQERKVMPYDNREPWMFLIRSEVLSQMEIPEDPFCIPRSLPESQTCIALNAYVHPFIDYYEEKRSDVLPLIPGGIATLLDIGCSRGNFGAAVRKELGCRVVGVEINAHEAQKARSKLDLVIEGNILTADITERFDCVTCLDVLEHVEHTEIFLNKIRSLLNKDGYLLLSIPNIGHWNIVEDLIAGRWDYVPAGILCITHLRFFTKRTIESLLRDAGFSIITIKENNTSLPGNASGWLNLLEQSGLDVNRKSLSCLGYYIVAQKIV
ncbi:MAG: class I SAM-dependent methyltransferase [Nitrospiraceae bacterium]|nr:class I SAM-dependent methyltransferase [Nitrospiraceae bacterium]